MLLVFAVPEPLHVLEGLTVLVNEFVAGLPVPTVCPCEAICCVVKVVLPVEPEMFPVTSFVMS